MLAGAGFGTAFLYSFAICLIQSRIIFNKKDRLVSIFPERILAVDEEPELRFEVRRGFPVLPGCCVRAGLEFNWHDRVISGSCVYKNGMRHGSIRLEGLRRGAYTNRGTLFLVNDAAGFFKFSCDAGTGGELAVKPSPRISAGLPRNLGTGGEHISRIIRKKRSDELTETRQYYPGDDVRRINWRTYAHTGQLFIRLGEELPNPESRLLVIIDLSGAEDTALNPAQLDLYLDKIVNEAAGLIERLNEAGVIVDCIVPPGKRTASDDPAALVPLWWDDSVIPAALIAKAGRGGCLLICPAFSRNADKLCILAAGAGMRVSVMVPLPDEPADEDVPGVPSQADLSDR